MGLIATALGVSVGAGFILWTARIVNQCHQWRSLIKRSMLASSGMAIIYPLSFGPMLWILPKLPEPIAGFVVSLSSATYAPLYWLCTKIEMFDLAMKRYADWWAL